VTTSVGVLGRSWYRKGFSYLDFGHNPTVSGQKVFEVKKTFLTYSIFGPIITGGVNKYSLYENQLLDNQRSAQVHFFVA